MGAAQPGMSWVPGGEFVMGSADFYAEERPEHRVAVDGFWMDAGPVTVAEFRRFVKATDVSGEPYVDLEREAEAMLSRE